MTDKKVDASRMSYDSEVLTISQPTPVRSSQNPIRILIADDHPIIITAISEMLSGAFDSGSIRVHSAIDGDSLLRVIGSNVFDYLVMDLYMPGRFKSVSLLRAVLKKQPQLQVLIYTGAELPFLALTTLEIGARAFVSKSSQPTTIIEAITAVMLGQTYIDRAIDVASTRSHPWLQLSSAEQAIILELARGENLQAIALDSDRSYKTVTSHKYNALRKLDLKSKDELFRYLEKHGLSHLLE
ncbi:response regulator transcription factor [Lysobacter sp. CA196]|uniref:response regulator transcription factor n=1 Tax=Lysobacter sp. CA196 TaxID=3455606 RepID=UPI003F8CF671